LSDFPPIPKVVWVGRTDYKRDFGIVKAKNVGIAAATARLFNKEKDEVSYKMTVDSEYFRDLPPTLLVA